MGAMPGMKDTVLESLALYLLTTTTSHAKDAAKASLDPQIIQKCWATLIQVPSIVRDDGPAWSGWMDAAATLGLGFP
jgi:hypothetical protein